MKRASICTIDAPADIVEAQFFDGGQCRVDVGEFLDVAYDQRHADRGEHIARAARALSVIADSSRVDREKNDHVSG